MLSTATLPTVDTLADRLRWVLRARGLSQRALSKAAGLAPSHVSLILNHLGSGVTSETVAALAKAAEVDPGWLATGEGDPEPRQTTVEPALDGHGTGHRVEPLMKHRPDFQAAYPAARRIAGATVSEKTWRLIADGRPWVDVPLTPAMLAAMAQVIEAHTPADVPQGKGSGSKGGPPPA